MKKLSLGLLLISSIHFWAHGSNPEKVVASAIESISDALVQFQKSSKDDDLDDGSNIIELYDSLRLVKLINWQGKPALKSQILDELDTHIDTYQKMKKDSTQKSIDATNQITALQKKSPKPTDYSKQLQKLSETRNQTNALLENNIEPILEMLYTLRSDIAYKQDNLMATKDALVNETTKSPERSKKLSLAQKDHDEAAGIKAYQEAKKALPPCCVQKADGQKCKKSDECRGSCDSGIFGNDKCQNGQKYCKNAAGKPAQCEIVRPAYYLEYMERHGLTPE